MNWVKGLQENNRKKVLEALKSIVDNPSDGLIDYACRYRAEDVKDWDSVVNEFKLL